MDKKWWQAEAKSCASKGWWHMEAAALQISEDTGHITKAPIPIRAEEALAIRAAQVMQNWQGKRGTKRYSATPKGDTK